MSLLAKYSVPSDDLDFFASLPCFQHYYRRPNRYIATPFISQSKVPDITSNSFFNETIKSPSTIVRAVTLIHRKAVNSYSDVMSSNDPGLESNVDDEADPAFLLFVQIGKGLNGFPDTVHGGVLASLVDESLSICVEYYRAKISKDKATLYTANLDISYHVPVPSSSVIYVRTWLRRKDGRKWFLDADLLTEDGKICVSAKSLWISQKVRAKL